MADIKDYGDYILRTYSLLAAGMAGLVTAIRAKENDPTLVIL